MTHDDEQLQLAGDFPPVTHEQWRVLVDGVLAKGLSEPSPEDLARRFERTLVSHTYDGIAIQPLYDGSEGQRDPGLPGRSPFIRGRTPLANSVGGWDVCQRVEVVGDGTATAEQSRNELENGATSLWLGLDGATSITANVLDRALGGVYLDLVAIRLDGPPEAADALVELWRRRGVAPGDARGTLGLDPLGEAARSGRFEQARGATVRAAETAQRCAAELPAVRALVVDATPYHGAGASDAEELGCALATSTAYLRALVDSGLSPAAAWGQMEIRLAATAEQFPTIAKFRAARRCLARVADVVGVDPGLGLPPLHAVTSSAMLSAYDPWVNLLRTTVACFGAGVGGADAVTVAPYDAVAIGADSTEMGRRLARNIQSLLLEESAIARIIDPAGGSWYVESLTDGLAAAAWAWFRQIEAAGGMLAALADGAVSERLETTWAARSARLATGADPLTGVSEFPDIDESPPAIAPDAPAASGPGLPVHRYPEAFERLRARSDRHLAEHGERPAVFLATLGNPAQFSARATFAKNLFEVVGVRALSDETPDVDQMATFQASGARLACICSNDKIYQGQASATARALVAAGAQRVYLAGRPGELKAEWEAAGIDEFVYQGIDRVEALSRALDLAGVA